MPQVVIAVGSNINHKKNIQQALESLSNTFGRILVSPVYKSAPCDKESSDNYYLNLVAAVDSELSVEDLKVSLRSIEAQQLREHNTGIVTIDLDLLLYGDWIGELDGNNVPHDDIQQCEFVLCPLADLLPNAVHPVIGKSYVHLWQVFQSRLSLAPISMD